VEQNIQQINSNNGRQQRKPEIKEHRHRETSAVRLTTATVNEMSKTSKNHPQTMAHHNLLESPNLYNIVT
jgi:hypothetical protein